MTAHDADEPDDLSISEAAKLCHVARATITRYLGHGRFPNAWKASTRRGPGTGSWLIPRQDLTDAGFHVDAASPDNDDEAPPVNTIDLLSHEVSELRGEVERLQAVLKQLVEEKVEIVLGAEGDDLVLDLGPHTRRVEDSR